jgi:hypothetical protein
MHFSISPIRATCLAQFVIHSKIIQNNYIMGKNNGRSSDVQMVFSAPSYEFLPSNSVLSAITA